MVEDRADEIAPSPDVSVFSNHRPALIKLLQAMSSTGFERFCAELLSRSGIENVEVTRPTRDGGIDGIGMLRINDFVLIPIAFQAKKNGPQNKVGSQEIQQLRGAMRGDIDKGIFFTTSTFSEDARKEARQPGSKQIELVDLDRILEICEQYQIGLAEHVILVP